MAQDVYKFTIGRPGIQRPLGDLLQEFPVTLIITVGDRRADAALYIAPPYTEVRCDDVVQMAYTE